MNSDKINEAALDYDANYVNAGKPGSGIVRQSYAAGALSNAAKEYWFAQFPSQQSNELKNYYDLCKEINTLQERYDENGYDCSPIIKLQRIIDHVKPLHQSQQKQLSDEEIEKLSAEVVTELGWVNNGCAEANDIKKAFIKGYKAAQTPPHENL